jgi:hypothetical protein
MYVRYVQHSLIPVHETKGWKVLSRMEDNHHGRYSVVMGKEENKLSPEIEEMLEDSPALKADGLDDAVIGIGYRCGQPDLLVYDVDKVLDILVERDGMSYEEAREFFDFNIGGAWMGEGTPVWLEHLAD